MRKVAILIIILGMMITGCGIKTPIIDAEKGREFDNNDPEVTVEPNSLSPQVQRALNTLTGDYDFESDLRSLDTTAQTATDALMTLDSTRSALSYIDQLKAISIPFVGSAWDLLLNVMDSVVYGSGTALGSLESGLREVLAFKDDLEDMENMDFLADLVSEFMANPTDENLSELLNSISDNYAPLSAVQYNVDGLFIDLDSLIKDIQITKQGLAGALNSLEISAISDTVNWLDSGIEEMLFYAKSAFSSVQDFSTPLNRTISMMDALSNGTSVSYVPGAPEVPKDPTNPPREITSTPTLTSTPTPTYTPTPTSISEMISDDPINRVVLYWKAVSDERYSDAWEMLTDGFKTRWHDNIFNDYKEGYISKDYCNISVANLKILDDSSGSVVVYALTTYYFGFNCSEKAEYEFDYELIYDQATKQYQIEQVKYHK